MPRKRTVTATFDRIRPETRLLYDWLREHHDDFAAELERTRVRDRWKLAIATRRAQLQEVRSQRWHCTSPGRAG